MSQLPAATLDTFLRVAGKFGMAKVRIIQK
jgi:hypothetical protein